MTTNSPNTTATTTGTPATYKSALVVLTTLFFMWGSLTSLNDVLIPYVQHVFNIRLAASMLIQTAFFSAYFFFSIPAAKIIDWIGYKRAILVGLLTMVVACLAFYPAAKIPSFPSFSLRSSFWRRNHHSSGRGESLCRGIGTTSDRL